MLPQSHKLLAILAQMDGKWLPANGTDRNWPNPGWPQAPGHKYLAANGWSATNGCPQMAGRKMAGHKWLASNGWPRIAGPECRHFRRSASMGGVPARPAICSMCQSFAPAICGRPSFAVSHLWPAVGGRRFAPAICGQPFAASHLRTAICGRPFCGQPSVDSHLWPAVCDQPFVASHFAATHLRPGMCGVNKFVNL
jgi:hypothetical protein